MPIIPRIDTYYTLRMKTHKFIKMKITHLSCQHIKPIYLISLMNKFKYSSIILEIHEL